ncbi:hypothetical protein QWZ08_14790 [Ferruginibacter paludis]|uniref:hypothetical protein n=1 Tax=Ferruginibacter paludis TaxID=1310417 RepID=UPI0025B2DEC7|nr:hypothetical protein [Ferruginibacter paludis]MDN3656912.1 hypothetical protein [Ferruginibacter paludis]
MNLTAQIAKQFSDVHFGGNWTAVNLKDTVADVTWQQATTKVNSFNTIATLVFHTKYYVGAVMKVLQSGPWMPVINLVSLIHPLHAAKTGSSYSEKYGRRQKPLPACWNSCLKPNYGTILRMVSMVITTEI